MQNDMNVEYKTLDARALHFVYEHLDGVNILCSALLDILNTQSGELFAFAPTDTPNEALYRFHVGGLLRQDYSQAVVLSEGQGKLVPTPSLTTKRADFARDKVVNTPGAICLVDDINPRWSELPRSNYPHAFGVGEEVYHLLTASEELDAYETAIVSGNLLWHGVAAICGYAPKVDGSHKSSADELRKAAEAVMEITLTAYDGESFVIWRRDNS